MTKSVRNSKAKDPEIKIEAASEQPFAGPASDASAARREVEAEYLEDDAEETPRRTPVAKAMSGDAPESFDPEDFDPEDFDLGEGEALEDSGDLGDTGDEGADEFSAELMPEMDSVEDDVLGAVLDYTEESGPETFLPDVTERSVKDGLSLYLREINKFPLLKPEEEVMLARRVKEFGDSEAAFRLVSSHLRLVVRIAMDFQRRWMQNVLDLIQEGNVGLLRAANKFDADKGIKFSYYASFWIKAYILKFIMDNWRMVKIGTTQNQRKLFYNLNKERQKLIAQGFDPSAKTLAENLGVSEENIIEMTQRMEGGDVSLDMPVGEDSGSSKVEFLPALGPGTEETLANHELSSLLHEKLAGIMPKLSEKEKDILQNRLLSDDPVTLREIGVKYDITRERVRQIETRLLQKLHTYLSKEIKDFSEEWIRQ